MPINPHEQESKSFDEPFESPVAEALSTVCKHLGLSDYIISLSSTTPDNPGGCVVVLPDSSTAALSMALSHLHSTTQALSIRLEDIVPRPVLHAMFNAAIDRAFSPNPSSVPRLQTIVIKEPLSKADIKKMEALSSFMSVAKAEEDDDEDAHEDEY